MNAYLESIAIAPWAIRVCPALPIFGTHGTRAVPKIRHAFLFMAWMTTVPQKRGKPLSSPGEPSRCVSES